MKPSWLDPLTPDHQVVLLHGLGGGREHWQGIDTALIQAGYQTVALDLPTDQILHVPDVAAQLADHIPPGIVLVGNSLGGWISLWAYRYQPAKIRALVLVAPTGLTGMITAVPKIRLGKQGINQALAEAVFAQPELLDGDLLHDITQKLRWPRMPLETLTVGQWHPQELTTIAVPTLILWGQEDRLIPVHWASLFANHLPQSEMVLIPGCGHLPQLEKPQAFLAALKHFLDHL